MIHASLQAFEFGLKLLYPLLHLGCRLSLLFQFQTNTSDLIFIIVFETFLLCIKLPHAFLVLFAQLI